MTKQYLRELHPSIPHIDLQQQQQRMLRILKDITSLDFPLIPNDLGLKRVHVV